MSDQLPFDDTPYEDRDGEATAGWSGSEASHERASDEATKGISKHRQQRILTVLIDAGGRGMTWREVSAATGWHHGQVTGALTVLHKNNLIARLRAKRTKCSIYVTLGNVDGRHTAPYHPNSKTVVPTLPVPTIPEEFAIKHVQARYDRGYETVCVQRDILADLLRFVKRAGG